MLAAGKARGGGVTSLVSITNQTLNGTSFSGAASCAYRLNLSGTVQRGNTGVFTTLETWLLFGSSSAYEARVTMLTGALTAGTTGSWLNLATTRDWSISDGAQGDGGVTCSFTVEIRDAASLVVLDSATIELTAQYF